MKKIITIITTALLLASTPSFAMSSIAKADETKSTTLNELNIISQPTLVFTEVVDFKGDKLVVGNRKGNSVTGNEKYGLINLSGKTLLDIKYTNILLLDNNYILVRATNGNGYLYDSHMKFVKKFKEISDAMCISGNAFVLKQNNNDYLYMIINGTCKKIDSIYNPYSSSNSITYFDSVKDTGTGFEYTQKATGKYFFVAYDGTKTVLNNKKMIIPGFYIDLNNNNIVNEQGKVIITNYDKRQDIRHSSNYNYLVYTTSEHKNIAVSKDGTILDEGDYINSYNTFYTKYDSNTEEDTIFSLDHKKIVSLPAKDDYSLLELGEKYIGVFQRGKGIDVYDLSANKISSFTISTDTNNHAYTDSVAFINELNAFEIKSAYYDSGVADINGIMYCNIYGNDIFQNNLNITNIKYLDNGYYVFHKDGKNYIGLLPSFPKKEIYSIAKKIVVPADKPAKTKIKKVWKKKKSSKFFKLSVKKGKKISGYEVRIYRSNKNAKKNIKYLVKKTAKKTKIAIHSKKLAQKKYLFVRVRAYRQDIKGKIYGNWSTIKKVKAVK